MRRRAAAVARLRNRRARRGRRPRQRKRRFALFAQGQGVEQVAQAIGRARSTIVGYLTQYIAEQRPERIDAWVDEPTYRRVAAAAATSEDGRLKPLFDRLAGEVPYDVIRLVVTHLQATGRQPPQEPVVAGG